MKPVFSIIVPVYKTEAFLDACVKSVQDQSFPDIEIILVDDGSPDSCPALCDAYAAQDARVKVFHKQNGGLSDARNTGIAAASGEYILLLDSDDCIDADACNQLLPFAQKGVDIIVGEGVSIGAKKNLSHRLNDCQKVYTGEEYLSAALKSGSMPMAACLYVYRRAFLLENGLKFQSGILHEDEEFTPRAFLAAEAVANSGVCFYRYMIRDDSITSQKDLRKNATDLYAICQSLSARYEKLADEDLRRRLLDSLVVKYLSLFQQGRLYQYGKTYAHKEFVRKYAVFSKTRAKARLFCLSPRLYWYVNNLAKKISS